MPSVRAHYAAEERRAMGLQQKLMQEFEVTIAAVAGVEKDDKLVAVEGVMVEQVTINNVEFEFDSAELSPAYRQELDLASDALKPHRALLRQGLAALNVVGYTDSRGNDVYNQ